MTEQSPEDSAEPSAADPAAAGRDRFVDLGTTYRPPREPRPTSGRTGGQWVKVSKRKRRRRRRIRRITLAAIGGLVLLAAVYLVITAFLARRELNTVRAEVTQLRGEISAGDLQGARTTAATLATHAHSAHQLTTGPVWAGAAELPGGGPLDSIRRIASGLDVAGSNALPELVSASDIVDPTHLRSADGTVDLARIASASPALSHAAAAMQSATSIVSGAPADTWLDVVDSARSTLIDQLTPLSHTVDGAAVAARVAPALLGATSPKNYLVSFETEAELRGTGGLPGAFAILHADHGKISFTRFESDSTLGGVKTNLDFGTDFDQLYAGDAATDEYADSNVSAHFPYAAQIWVAMWKKYSGQTLDGAFALDPTALSYLLAVTGPAPLPDHSTVSAANVVALTQKDVYAKFTDPKTRKQRQLDIARAIGQHVIAGHPDTTALLRAAGKAAGERRLLGWSSDPKIEAELAGTALGGTVRATDAPFVGLALNNAAATKLDYYFDASLTWRRTGCGDTRQVTVTITLTNNAPEHLPTYVYGQTGRPNRPKHPGDNALVVSYYATNGAQTSSVTLDGKPSAAGSGLERGHSVFSVLLDIARGATRTIVLHLKEPAGTGSPVVMPQPMVNPLQVKIDDQSCG